MKITCYGKKIIHKNSYVEVCFFDEISLGQVAWLRANIPSDIYREAWDKILEFSKTNTVKNFLSDGRLQGVESPADRKWFMNSAVKRAAQNGLVRAVVINKKDPFKKYYMNIIMKFVTRKSPIDMKIFYDYDEGVEWLKSFGEHLK